MIKTLIYSFWLSLSLTALADPASHCLNTELGIALDVGHSPSKPGAISARGRGEYSFNYLIATLLLDRLQRLGFKNAFLLTASNPEMPLHARASLVNARQSAILVSIHHDSVQPHYLDTWEYEGEPQRYSDHFQGFSIFISEKNGDPANSLKFARFLGEELIQLPFQPTLHHAEAIAGENRPLLDASTGIYRYDELILLKNTKIPAVLLECGVIVNREEESRLATPAYQHLLVAALERALLRYAQRPAEPQNCPLAPLDAVSTPPTAQGVRSAKP